MGRRATTVLLAVAAIAVMSAWAPAEACAPQPAITVASPASQSINLRPVTVTGTATALPCDGATVPIEYVTVAFTPLLDTVPKLFIADCTGCPGADVTWSLTTSELRPSHYTVDADARDTAGSGARVRLQFFVI